MPDARARLLHTAIGFALVPPTAPELRLLHRWLDCWRGVGDVVTGMILAVAQSRTLRYCPRARTQMRMKAPAWFAIAVALVFLGGCRSSVTGVWAGDYRGYHFSQDVVLVLQQQEQRVTGKLSGLKVVPGGGSISIDGIVNGDTFSFWEVGGLTRIRG